MRQLPPLNWLRAFETAGRHLSFTRAADELGVTHAAISQHVKALEGFLGMKLFRRAHQRLILTEAGTAFMPKLTSAFDLMMAGTSEVFSYSTDGGLTVRVPASFSTQWLIPRLEKFHAAYPGIDIRITALGREADFTRDDVDLEIRHGTGEWAPMDSALLVHEQVFPVCSPLFLEGIGGMGSPGDLGRITLLDVPGYAEGWDAWLSKAGGDDFSSHSIVSFDQSLMAVQAAVNGLGVALGRSALVEQELSAGRLVAPFDIRLDSSTAYYIVCPQEFLSRPRIAAFRDWLMAEVQ